MPGKKTDRDYDTTDEPVDSDSSESERGYYYDDTTGYEVFREAEESENEESDISE